MGSFSLQSVRFLISKQTRNAVCAFVVFLMVLAPGAKSFAAASAPENMYPAWVKVGGEVGNHDRDLGLVDVFVPVVQSPDDLWLTDFRYKDASGPENEYNVGGGYRRMVNDAYILGMYGFFDRLQSTNRNYFSQGTVGVEALTENWDLRANGYFPEAKKELVSESDNFANPDVVISGTSIATSISRMESFEQALPGFDAEVGYRIPAIAPDIRVFAGGFYFKRSDSPEVSGPRARTEWRIEDFLGFQGTRLTINGEYTHDQVRDSQVFAGASIRIPFGPGATSSSKRAQGTLSARMVEPIVRDVDIVSAPTQSTSQTILQPAINPLTGVAYSGIWFAKQGGTGTGTEADPALLSTAITSAGANGIVAALDAAGVFNVAGTTLLNGQTLIGSGGNLVVHTPQGVTATKLIAGTSTVIKDTTGGDVITLAHNNTISDITVDGNAGTSGNNGIVGGTPGDVHLKNVTVQGVDSNGLDLANAGNVVIEDSTFNTNGSYGMLIDTADNVTLTNVTADTNDSGNLHITTVAGNVTIGTAGEGTSSFSGSNSGYGIDIWNVTGDTDIANVTADENYESNLRINNNTTNGNNAGATPTAGNVTIASSEFNGATNGDVPPPYVFGIEIRNIGSGAGNGNVTLTNVIANGNKATGLHLNDVWGNVTITSSTFNDSVENNGLNFLRTHGNTTLTDVTAEGNFLANLDIDNDNTEGNVTIASSHFNNSANENGIYLVNVGNGVGTVIMNDSEILNNAGDDIFFDANVANFSIGSDADTIIGGTGGNNDYGTFNLEI